MFVHRYTEYTHYCYQATFNTAEQQELTRIANEQNRSVENIVQDFIENGLSGSTDDDSKQGV